MQGMQRMQRMQRRLSFLIPNLKKGNYYSKISAKLRFFSQFPIFYQCKIVFFVQNEYIWRKSKIQYYGKEDKIGQKHQEKQERPE